MPFVSKDDIVEQARALFANVLKFNDLYGGYTSTPISVTSVGGASPRTHRRRSYGQLGPIPTSSPDLEERPQTRTVIEHHYHNPYPFYPLLVSPMGQRTAVVNNNTYVGTSKEEKKDDDKKKQNHTGIATIGLVATAGTLTYVVAKDGYMRMWLSSIPNEVKDIKYNLTKLAVSDPAFKAKVYGITEKVEKWISQMTTRTQKSLCTKAAIGTSAATFFGSLFFDSNSGFYASVAGLTGASCYALWRYLVDDSMPSEDSLFRKAVDGLSAFLATVNRPDEETHVDKEKETKAVVLSQQQEQGHQKEQQENGPKLYPSGCFADPDLPSVPVPIGDGYYQMPLE